jgi:hypothetical protein
MNKRISTNHSTFSVLLLAVAFVSCGKNSDPEVLSNLAVDVVEVNDEVTAPRPNPVPSPEPDPTPSPDPDPTPSPDPDPTPSPDPDPTPIRTIDLRGTIDNYYMDGDTVVSSLGYSESGQWSTSSFKGAGKTIVRESVDPEALVTYSAQVLRDHYCLSFYNVGHPQASHEITLSIYVDGVEVDQIVLPQNFPHGHSGWISLGDYHVMIGSMIDIVLENQDSARVFRADALKFDAGTCN